MLPFLLALGAAGAVIGLVASSRRLAVVAAGTLAVCAVLVSPLVDRVILQPSTELTKKLFGFPFPFVRAELTLTPTRPIAARWNPWEHPATVVEQRLLASVAAAVFLTAAAAALAGGAQVEWPSRRRRAAPSD